MRKIVRFAPATRRFKNSMKTAAGIDMSGWRPLIKGYFAVLRLIVGAVTSSACRCES
jgi:hypothetical protein